MPDEIVVEEEADDDGDEGGNHVCENNEEAEGVGEKAEDGEIEKSIDAANEEKTDLELVFAQQKTHPGFTD